jgi:hypothetical protein
LVACHSGPVSGALTKRFKTTTDAHSYAHTRAGALNVTEPIGLWSLKKGQKNQAARKTTDIAGADTVLHALCDTICITPYNTQTTCWFVSMSPLVG